MYIKSIKRSKTRLPYLRVTAVAVAVLFGMLCVPAPTAADDLSDRLSALQKQQQQQQQVIDSKNANLTTAAQKKAALDKSINLIIQQSTILNSQISTLNAQIDSKNRDIAATQANIDATFKLYKQRLRAMYETGDASYVNVLLSSANFTDFLSRAEVLRVVSEHDNKVIDDLKQAQARLNADQAALKTSQASLLSTKNTLAAQQAAVGTQIAQQSQIVSQMTQDASAAKQQKSQTDAEINSVIAQIAAARAQAGPSGNSSDIVTYAKSFADGTHPYCLGTIGPKYYDCSGFTATVIANTIGYGLYHDAEAQSRGVTTRGIVGTKITNRNNLQPGDLVFFAIGVSYVDHVGIYIGNDQFVAANSSTGIAISPLFSMPYWNRYYQWGWRFT